MIWHACWILTSTWAHSLALLDKTLRKLENLVNEKNCEVISKEQGYDSRFDPLTLNAQTQPSGILPKAASYLKLLFEKISYLRARLN